MPTTVGGLLILAVFLVPGSIFHLKRQRIAGAARHLSPLLETASVLIVSVVTNLVALGLFAAVRAALPEHTPDISRLVRDGFDYVADRSGYVLVWAAGILAVSSALAWLAGAQWGPVGWLSRRVTPVIADVSGWYHVFEACPPDKWVYVGCDLHDGSYLGGYLDWYSTEAEETPDRDLVLAEPILFRPPDAAEHPLTVSRTVVSAREVRRLYVSYLDVAPG